MAMRVATKVEVLAAENEVIVRFQPDDVAAQRGFLRALEASGIIKRNGKETWLDLPADG